MLIFDGETGLPLAALLRPGKVGAACGAVEMLAYLLWSLFREANAKTPELKTMEVTTARARRFNVGGLLTMTLSAFLIKWNCYHSATDIGEKPVSRLKDRAQQANSSPKTDVFEPTQLKSPRIAADDHRLAKKYFSRPTAPAPPTMPCAMRVSDSIDLQTYINLMRRKDATPLSSY